MITCKLYGRLGNNLFQMAATIAHALHNGTDFRIPMHLIYEYLPMGYFRGIPPLRKTDSIRYHYREVGHDYHGIPFVDDMELDGYFQSEKYFLKYRPDIIRLFNFQYQPTPEVSIHVRRGDYLAFPESFPPVTLEYLHQAIERFPGRDFLFFSDDIPWCRKHFRGDRFGFAINPSDIQDLEQMSCCTDHIISNSSFSWWGAWLDRDPQKRVIAPGIWFGPKAAHLSTKDIIPPSWIKI